MRNQTFDVIAARVAALPVDTKISSMWKAMRHLSRSSLSGAHAVLFLALYGRVRASCAVPTIDLGELALEVGVSGTALADLMGDLENDGLVMIDGARGKTVRATIPALLADRSRNESRTLVVGARFLH